jgi:bifunctional non-homologous end joining protein LigD
MAQRSTRAAGLIEPCLPSPAKAPPSGRDWSHEIKHNGFRILALRDAAGVRLYTRGGHDFAARFPLIVAAVTALPVRSCFIDGEAIVCDDSGLAVFYLMRRRRSGLQAALCAFDLLELDDEEVRRLPIEERKRMLAKPVHRPHPGIALNEHYVGHGDIVYQQACKLGCEGIVSKRLGSLYRSGHSRHWLKVKNPAAPAVRREAEGDWGG